MAGVDGVPGGWVVARVTGRAVEWARPHTAAQVLEVTAGCVAVGVDIPLGLPTGRESRRCDVEAARRLGRARAAVFATPPRPVLAAGTYEEACRVAEEVIGRRISLQSFHIGAKILEWDDAGPLPDHVVEVHPELSFRALAPHVRFEGKKTARGAGQRIAALSGWVDPARAFADLPSGARLDDVLDALAAAWSAGRLADGVAEDVGTELDDRGRAVRIVV
ncbi:MAG TPA: DUF429 domain-containing protein [Pseudonocardia sp.]|nr:DUF429 domain-containing protein [Pseudonocardia sp.]